MLARRGLLTIGVRIGQYSLRRAAVQWWGLGAGTALVRGVDSGEARGDGK